MKNIFNVGEFVRVVSCKYGESVGTVGQLGEIAKVNAEDFDYHVKFSDNSIDYYNENELEELKKVVNVPVEVENALVIHTPTFNLEELPLGSLIHINKGYLQLQGFVAAITPQVLTIAYYDEDSDCYQCSHETVDIKDIISGKHIVELIRKPIPLELQGA